MQSQMIYKWSIPLYPVDPQVAGRELEKISETHGCLKPAYVVEESREESAPLHGCFEWDNDRAAEKFRCGQAQDLIRNIVAVKIGALEPATPTRAFISIRQNHEYVPVMRVLQEPALQQSMMAAALKELESFRQKYSGLKSLSKLMSAIDGCIDQNARTHKKRRTASQRRQAAVQQSMG